MKLIEIEHVRRGYAGVCVCRSRMQGVCLWVVGCGYGMYGARGLRGVHEFAGGFVGTVWVLGRCSQMDLQRLVCACLLAYYRVEDVLVGGGRMALGGEMDRIMLGRGVTCCLIWMSGMRV